MAVEACVRGYARKSGADEELWGVTALLHDFDYERWPNDAHHPTQEHPFQGSTILRERGYPEEMIHAILVTRITRAWCGSRRLTIRCSRATNWRDF